MCRFATLGYPLDLNGTCGTFRDVLTPAIYAPTTDATVACIRGDTRKGRGEYHGCELVYFSEKMKGNHIVNNNKTTKRKCCGT